MKFPVLVVALVAGTALPSSSSGAWCSWMYRAFSASAPVEPFSAWRPVPGPGMPPPIWFPEGPAERPWTSGSGAVFSAPAWRPGPAARPSPRGLVPPVSGPP